jgi:tetraacyldisaccharide 4'-kinase
MVSRVGIEPTTHGLKGRCSTAELPARPVKTYTNTPPSRHNSFVRWDHIWNWETMPARLASTALLPLSWIYAVGWRSYAAVYQTGIKKRWIPDIPVMGIGALNVGGAAKTPLTIAIARLLEQQGLKTAISASAYGSPSASQTTVIMPHEPLVASKHGDEPALIRKKMPHIPLILGRHRVQAAKIAEKLSADVLLLDDGFQHLPLARTIDLVSFDATQKNRRCLPAGPLREPVAGLKRASATVSENQHHITEKPHFMYERVFVNLIQTKNAKTFPIEWLQDKTVNVMCAIARPNDFVKTLQKLGANIQYTHFLPDHAAIDTKQLHSDQPCIITEKDAVKINQPPDNVFELVMETHFQQQDALTKWLIENLS